MVDYSPLANAGLIIIENVTLPTPTKFIITIDNPGSYPNEASWRIYKGTIDNLGDALGAAQFLNDAVNGTQSIDVLPIDSDDPGDYILSTADSYGDKWNGAKITVHSLDSENNSYFRISTTGPPTATKEPYNQTLDKISSMVIPKTSVDRDELKAMIAHGFTIHQLIAGNIYTLLQIKTEFSGVNMHDLTTSDYGSNSAESLLELGYTVPELTSGGFALWTKIGDDIDGEAANDQSGESVSLSSDGQIVAIGARYNDGNGNAAGHVRVYQRDADASTGWTQLGNDIDGEAAGDFSGWSVSLSSDGEIVAIGAIYNDGNGGSAGHVRVYEYASTGWTQLGNDIDGEAASDQSGWSVSLSSDGKTVAIGATGNDGNGNGAGHVRVYEYASTEWTQVGNDIDGEAQYNYSGFSVSLSSDGQIVAIGANANSGNGQYAGHVRVYQRDADGWTQLGNDIDGEAAGDQSGYSVSLSSDGKILAIGALLNDGNGNNAGHVRVYQRDASTGWTQLGNDIDGEAAGNHSGRSVSLSSDGQIVAIGAIYNDGNGADAGHVRVYQRDAGGWTQLGIDIDGEAASDQSGYSVSLSSDGKILAIGAIYNDGKGSSAGHVRVYQLPETQPTPVPICFPKGTPVTTDQGNIFIEKLNPDKHTIRGKEIVAITQSRPLQKHIVCFEKDSFSKNVPSQQTLCSMEHAVFYKGEMMKARDIVDVCENTTFVPYNGETLFNVLLKKHDKMMINNLICETLHPENIMAKINMMKDGQKKSKAIQEVTKIIKKNDVPAYNKLYVSL